MANHTQESLCKVTQQRAKHCAQRIRNVLIEFDATLEDDGGGIEVSVHLDDNGFVCYRSATVKHGQR